MQPLHVVIDLSDRRRVLLVSDIHGRYDLLEEQLAAMGWDPLLDVLIINGDLADRGPHSMRAMDVIRWAGVIRTLGNHEEMPGMFLKKEVNAATARKWGGDWFVDLPDHEIARIDEAFRAAPVALTVTTPIGRKIGIIHADCLPDWDEHVSILEDRHHPRHERIYEMSLWDRDTVERLIHDQQKGGKTAARSRCIMKGVDHVFHGHTPFNDAFAHDDRSWIDTAACYGNKLTIINVDDWLDRIDMHSPYR